MESTLKILLSSFFKLTAKISPKYATKLAWSFFCKPRKHNKPLSELEKDLLQQAKQYFIDSDEYKIAVYQWDNINNSTAKTVLLTHGWGGHALNFSHIIQRLILDGFNVIAYDSPAHGNSSGQQTTLLCNTQALLSTVQHVSPISTLIGHSFGSMANAYAIDLAKETTQLSNVENIVLIAGPNKLSDIFASFTQAMQLPNSVLNNFYQKVEALTQRKIETMNTARFLQDYSGQALVIHDHKDRVVPFSEARSVAEEISSRLFSTTGYGHGRILASKDVLNEISGLLQTNYN